MHKLAYAFSAVGLVACGGSPADFEYARAEQDLVSDCVPSVATHYLRIQEQQAGRYFDVSTTRGEGSRVYGGGYAPVDNQEFAVLPRSRRR